MADIDSTVSMTEMAARIMASIWDREDYEALAEDDGDMGPLFEAAVNEASRIGAGGRASRRQMAARRIALWLIVRDIQVCTVRQVYYQATVHGLVDKTESGYEKVQRALVQLRRNEDMPFAWIADNTRWMRKPKTFDSVEEALAHTAATYRRALMSAMDAYVEIWLEKDALAGVIVPITAQYDVPLMVARGYSSITFLNGAAEAIEAQDKPAYIYHVGDWDPWGQKAADTIEATLRELAPRSEIHFEKLAVTPEQIERWNLPSRPTKQVGIGKKWKGGDSVELDAIHPDELRTLVRQAIERHIDPRQLITLQVAEASERELLKAWRPDASSEGRA